MGQSIRHCKRCVDVQRKGWAFGCGALFPQFNDGLLRVPLLPLRFLLGVQSGRFFSEEKENERKTGDGRTCVFIRAPHWGNEKNDELRIAQSTEASFVLVCSLFSICFLMVILGS